MNVMVSLHSSDVSWAGMGPMTGTVSSKSWNAWVDEPSQVTGFGNVDVLGHTVVEQHIHSMR